MISREDYLASDATSLAKAVLSGVTTARELYDLARELIAEANPILNFLVNATPQIAEEALTSVQCNGAFAGVPFLLKDIAVSAKDMPCEMGSLLAVGHKFSSDSALMARLKQAGLVTLGTSATPEMGYSATTEPRKGGPTRNPWDVTRMAGGSSGGAAAAVAAGIVPIAHGSDAAGSIRIPAACCGLFGLKPSRGRTSVGPGISNGPFGHYNDGFLTRTVRDNAAALDAISGAAPGELFVAPPSPETYLAATGHDPVPLRIGLSIDAPNGGAVDRQVRDAVEMAARLCEDLGHDVEETDPFFDWADFMDVSKVMHNLWRPSRLEAIAAQTGNEISSATLEEINLTGYELAKTFDVETIARALTLGNTFSRAAGEVMERFDVLLHPVNVAPALALGTLKTDGMGWTHDEYLDDLFSFCAHNGIYNITGQPAMSVPLYETTSGLPLGVQFVGRYGEEHTLFSLAAQLERVVPWADRISPMRRQLAG